MNARAALLAAVALAGCGSRYPKQAPLDLDALPGPAPSAFGSENDLATRWPTVIEPAWNAGRDGDFIGVGNVRVHYHVNVVPNAKGAVLVLPGRTEPALKYAEVMVDLAQQGYTTYLLDLRGQGASQRMLADPDKGYVEFFEDYVSDVEQLWREVIVPDAPARLYVLAHSTGGAVAILWADRHPELAAMALSAPMLEIATGAFPAFLASTISLTDCSISDGSGYAIGMGPYMRETDFSANTVTHSEPRWSWKVQLYDDNPALRLGGVTYRWLCQSLTASSHASKIGGGSNIPTVLFQAGQDKVVKPGGENSYCDAAARCQITRLDGAYHEMFHETDALRNLALSQAVKLFDAVAR